MTKKEKDLIYHTAMEYDFAAGLDPNIYPNEFRDVCHFGAMLKLMEKLNIKDGYADYVNEHKDILEKWKGGMFDI